MKLVKFKIPEKVNTLRERGHGHGAADGYGSFHQVGKGFGVGRAHARGHLSGHGQGAGIGGNRLDIEFYETE